MGLKLLELVKLEKEQEESLNSNSRYRSLLSTHFQDSRAEEEEGHDEEEPQEDHSNKRLQHLKVYRMDGSFFDVEVDAEASVGDLKAAVEKTVNELARIELGKSDILWNRVWTHFCLCYMHQKLLDNTATLKSHGIQDRDKLSFVHHVEDYWQPQTKPVTTRKRIRVSTKHLITLARFGKKVNLYLALLKKRRYRAKSRTSRRRGLLARFFCS